MVSVYLKGVKMPKDEKSVALEAHGLIHGARRKQYGPVEVSFQRIATLANVMLDDKLSDPLTPGDVAKFMLCVKMARERGQHHRDNCVDLCGYADLLQQLAEKQQL